MISKVFIAEHELAGLGVEMPFMAPPDRFTYEAAFLHWRSRSIDEMVRSRPMSSIVARCG